MYYFIINPSAGKGKIVPSIQNLLKKLAEKKILGEYMKTTGKGDAMHLARIAIKKGYSTIVVVGGDGTVFEVFNGIAESKVVLGVIPSGSKNIFAKTLGIPEDMNKAIDIIAARKLAFMDVGKIVEKKEYFPLSCGIGMELEFLRCNKKPSSFFSCMDSSIKKALSNAGSFEIECVVDRKYRMVGNIYNCSIVNSNISFEGGYPKMAFDRNNDTFDVFLLFDKKFSRSLKNNKKHVHIRAKEIHIETKIRRDVHINGNISAKTPITFQMASFKQKVIV